MCQNMLTSFVFFKYTVCFKIVSRFDKSRSIEKFMYLENAKGPIIRNEGSSYIPQINFFCHFFRGSELDEKTAKEWDAKM